MPLGSGLKVSKGKGRGEESEIFSTKIKKNFPCAIRLGIKGK